MSIFARYWYNMDAIEFGDLTPKMFWDLWKQRQNEFKREQYLQGITASIIAAVHGAKNVTPWDFVGKTAEQAFREDLVSALSKTHNQVRDAFPDRLSALRVEQLTRLQAQNFPDAEEVIAEVFGD